MAHRVVKRPVYRRVIRHADRIILNVPETRQLIEPWLNSRDRDLLLQKAVELRLGFDPEHFFFDRDERRRWRSEHGIADDEVLLATCTRALPSKNLEEVIDTVSVLRTGGMRLRYALAGLLEDGYAKHLRAHARSQPDPDALLLLPALKRDEMRELFCASDLGFWPRAAITIQQGMGTGLPIVLRRAPSVSHLLVPGRNGWYVAIGETLEHALARAIESLSAPTVAEGLARRRQVADLSRSYLSYDVLASAMINGL